MTQVLEAPGPAEELFHQKPTVGRRVHSMLHRFPALSPLVVLVVAFIAFSLVKGNFAKPGAVSLLLQEVAVIGALAVGQTLIVLTAGIDLSVGAVMILSAFIMGKLQLNGTPGFVAFLVGLLIAVATGLVNGFLVTRLKLPPFIVTLGTLSIFTAISLIYAQGSTLSLTDGFLTATGKTF
jgi:fructose transport system permease protein